jgi:cytochrome c biogenesis protein CcmG, thiol:disulfide interchange protein DsbE
VPVTRGRGVRLAALSVVAVAAVLAVVFAIRFGDDPGLVPSPLVGRPAPEAELPLLDGSGSVRLADFEGEIVVLNFFASWCLECIEEHADLVATAEAFDGAGVRFVQVAYQDQIAAANRFLDDLGRSPATVYATDPGSRAAIAFGVFGVPETYFIGPDGIVQGKIQGASNALLLGETIDLIRRGGDPGQQVVGDVQQAP